LWHSYTTATSVVYYTQQHDVLLRTFNGWFSSYLPTASWKRCRPSWLGNVPREIPQLRQPWDEGWTMDAQNPRTAAVAIVHRPAINKPFLRERGQTQRFVYRVPINNITTEYIIVGSKLSGVVVLLTQDIGNALTAECPQYLKAKLNIMCAVECVAACNHWQMCQSIDCNEFTTCMIHVQNTAL
jgi:hypothetical protein